MNCFAYCNNSYYCVVCEFVKASLCFGRTIVWNAYIQYVGFDEYFDEAYICGFHYFDGYKYYSIKNGKLHRAELFLIFLYVAKNRFTSILLLTSVSWR